MHVGSYDMEPVTIGKMKALVDHKGLSIAIDDRRMSHEISDILLPENFVGNSTEDSQNDCCYLGVIACYCDKPAIRPAIRRPASNAFRRSSSQ